MLRPHQWLLEYFWWARRKLVSSHPIVKEHDFSIRRRVDNVRYRQHRDCPEKTSHVFSQELRRQPVDTKCPTPPDARCDRDNEAWIKIVYEDRQNDYNGATEQTFDVPRQSKSFTRGQEEP